MPIEQILKNSPIIPVIMLDNIQQALPLAQALADGGLTTLEITLRTPVSLTAIELLAEKMPACTIGAGTVTQAKQFSQIKQAGAAFAISPGINSVLVDAAQKINMPYLPAISTPSEILLALQHQLSCLKFFPASQFGGVTTLKAFSVLFPTIKFCPTGGIDRNNLADYLKSPNVLCVGGSWLAPKQLIDAGDWQAITQLARDAIAIWDQTK